MQIDITYRYEARDQPARPQPSDSDAALRRLCDGNGAFAALFSRGPKDADRAQTVVQLDPRDVGLSADSKQAPKQHPFAAILGCADARVPVELIFPKFVSSDVRVGSKAPVWALWAQCPLLPRKRP